MVIPVDPFGARSNVRGSRKAVDFLAQGGAVVIFPAGAVSHFQWKERSITDPKWSRRGKIVALAARRAESLTVVPAYVEGANSVLFQAAGVVHPLLRTLLLGRELLNKRRTAVEVRTARGSPRGNCWRFRAMRSGSNTCAGGLTCWRLETNIKRELRRGFRASARGALTIPPGQATHYDGLPHR